MAMQDQSQKADNKRSKKKTEEAVMSSEIMHSGITHSGIMHTEELVDEGDMYSLLNHLESEINKIIEAGDHHVRNFEVKRYIQSIRKSTELKRAKKYLGMISTRIPGRLARIVKDIRMMISLAEDGA